MKRRAIVLVGAAAVFVLLLAGVPAFVRLTVDWYWFTAVGYEPVFLRTIATQLVLGFGVGLLAFAFLYGNLWLAQRGALPKPVLVTLNPKAPNIDISGMFRYLAFPLCLFVAFLIGAAAAGEWLTVLRWLYGVPFETADPVFGRDVGYYVFTLPAVAGALGVAFGVVIVTVLFVLPVYVLKGDLVIGRRVAAEPTVQLHLGALGGLLLLLLAANVFFVRIPSLLYSTTGPLFGASYADLAARLPVLRAAALVALVGAGLVFWGARRRRLVPYAVGVFGVYVVVSGLLGALVPALVQRLVVLPNELAKETPQLEHHIAATRAAWGLDEVEVRGLTGDAGLSLSDIEANSGTIKNVRLWDRGPLLQTFGQMQAIRTYYDFVTVDDDRYWIDGEYRQVLLSPRELNTASLPTRTFINERLTFTHGMGLTLSPVNEVTREGLPVLFIKDLPPASDVSLDIVRPAIYYGELSNDFVFVNTRQPEFDFPAREGNAFATYEGRGGVAVASWFRTVLLSIRFGSLKMLLSDDITNDSRVLFHRNITERAAKALPFLRWDADPYMVITDDGQLKWILDSYTSTSRYPYAQPIADGTNYLRNSVKVVIDAYDGSVDAYVAEPEDPIIRTYAAVFPGIFQPLEAMPADLRAHLRYPEDLFRAQTALFTTYHMSEPQILYHREDQWQIPVLGRRGDTRDPFLRHIVMKLPGESREEFILMTPFTPQQKDNLAAWMVARNDGEHYGQLVVYRFPRQSLVFGPTQIMNRINQDTEISRQISLWDQRGSEVIRGNLLVIPIEESLIFVQALYLRAEGGQIPELKQVIVAYQNEVVMEETLDRSLRRLFGRSESPDARPLPLDLPVTGALGRAGPDPVVADLIRQAMERYEQAVSAQQAGDWARYGEELQQVGELLRRLRTRVETESPN